MTDGERAKYRDDLKVLQIAIQKVVTGSKQEVIYTAMSVVLGAVLDDNPIYGQSYDVIMREIRGFGVAAVTPREQDKRGY